MTRFHLSPTEILEFFLGNAEHFAGVQFGGPGRNLFIVDPLVGVFQAAQKQDCQFGPFGF